MIGKLKGSIDQVYKNSIILDVSGVGYLVFIPTNTLVKITKGNKKITLFIHTYVREDALELYGFETIEHLLLFEKLLSISGIGAKTSLSVLSSGSISQITKAVIDTDIDFFVSIPGIGKKSAQRIIIDLKSSLGDDSKLDIFETTTPALDETIQALKQFGFTKSESIKAVRQIKNKSSLTTEELLNQALKLL